MKTAGIIGRMGRMLRKNRRLVANIVAVMVSALLMALVMGLYLRDELMRSLQSSTEMMFSTVYDAVEEKFDDLILTAHGMSTNTFLIDALKEEKDDPEAFQAKVSEYLESKAKLYGWSTAFVISNQTMRYYLPGNNVETIDPAKDEQDKWYSMLVNSDDDYHIDIDVDQHNTNKWTIFIDVCIYDEQGNTLGVCGFGLALERIMGIAQRYAISYDMDVEFSSADGSVRISPDGINMTEAQYNVAEEAPKETTGELTKNGYRISRRLSLADWYLVVENDKNEVSDSIHGLVAIAAAMLALALAFVLLLNMRFFSTERKALTDLARTDSLTGLLNRAGIEQQVGDLLSKAGSDPALEGCFLMLDLDHFKEINDTYGHDFGDGVLQDVAEVLHLVFRETDVLGRLGGDEYVAFLPGMQGADVIDRKMRELRDRSHRSYGDAKRGVVNVSMSIGVALVPANGSTYEELYKAADDALYEAKRSGRDCYRMAR